MFEELVVVAAVTLAVVIVGTLLLPRLFSSPVMTGRGGGHTNDGPGTNITFAPYDHRGYKGDFLTIRELRGGRLIFKGYYRPQWPSNRV